MIACVNRTQQKRPYYPDEGGCPRLVIPGASTLHLSWGISGADASHVIAHAAGWSERLMMALFVRKQESRHDTNNEGGHRASVQ